MAVSGPFQSVAVGRLQIHLLHGPVQYMIQHCLFVYNVRRVGHNVIDQIKEILVCGSEKVRVEE